MRIKFLKPFYLSIFVFILVSCDFKNGSQAAIPDSAPKFSRVNLSYNDTTDPVCKQMIYNLDTFYQRQVLAGFNGSVLVGYKGKILYERYYGVSQKESGAKWTSESQSQLASTSKTLTSGAILLLKDKGLLAFDDLVTKYIPNFPYQDLTIRMLLNHRSGLPDYIKFVSKPIEKKYLDNDDVLNWFATKQPKQNFKTNTAFRYSNSNYAILASIVESISGMKFKYFMKRFLFTPIGMDNTFVIDPSEERICTATFCYNYKWQIEPDMHYDGVVGDKGVYSTVKDLYKWDQALYSGKFIKPSTLKEAYSPYSFEKPGIKNYGLGWRTLNYPDGVNIIYHNGWWHGNNTCFYRFIQDNFTIIVLGNRFNRNIYRQPQQIYNIVMGSMFSGDELETEE
ncbi:MAG TPA: serine hydrolase domain-containing protein [Chitinophagaceae bacterium]|nr:serine hydrolase domain-containing protein [Chitinophagaceae bacterium]